MGTPTDTLIPLAEVPDWLEANGFRRVSPQAVHKAATKGWLPVAHSQTVGRWTLRFVNEPDLRAYAERQAEKNR